MGCLAKVHHRRIFITEGGPIGKSFAIGVAIFSEIRPIGGHRIRYRPIGFGSFGACGIKMPKNIGHFLCMRRAIAKAGVALWVIRMLIEIIVIDLGSARL